MSDVYQIGRIRIDADRVPGLDYHVVLCISSPWSDDEEMIDRAYGGFIKTGIIELWSRDGVVYYKVSKKAGKYFHHNCGIFGWQPAEPQQQELF